MFPVVEKIFPYLFAYAIFHNLLAHGGIFLLRKKYPELANNGKPSNKNLNKFPISQYYPIWMRFRLPEVVKDRTIVGLHRFTFISGFLAFPFVAYVFYVFFTQ